MSSAAQRALQKSETPTWLNVAFVEDALLQDGQKDVKVSGITVHFATAPGDNYGSALYRVKAALADGGEQSLLVKTPPLTQVVAQAIADAGIFPRETIVLARAIPQMQRILDDASPDRFPPMAPRCLHHGSTPVDFMVLEDLAPPGFTMADRQRGLGLRHSLLALRALARFHAASAALLAAEPGISEGLDNPLRRPSDTFSLFFGVALDNAIKACRSWPGFEDYGTSYEKFKVDAVAKITEINDPRPGAFNVITHGDFWVNNIMYRYENGKPKDLRFVDFQGSHVASPALDLLYFLSTSLSEDVSVNHTDLLLRQYHRVLHETTSLLGLRAPTLEALKKDIDAHGAFAVYGVTVLLPIMKAKKVPDIDAAASGEDVGGCMYQDPTVKRWLQRVLPEYRRYGWLPR